MLDLGADLRYTLRGLRRSPAFTAVAALSMAFGIGTNAAVFTLLDQVLLRDLPVRDPAELVQVHARGTESYGGGMGDGTELSYPMYRDLRDENDVFAATFCRFPTNLLVGHAGRSERVYGEIVSGSFFHTLGVGAALGRVLAPDDDVKPGGHPVAVLGYRYWQTRFAGDAGVLGRSVTVNGHAFQVVGVAEPRFRGIDLGRPAAAYVPIAMVGRWAPLAPARHAPFPLGPDLRPAEAGVSRRSAPRPASSRSTLRSCGRRSATRQPSPRRRPKRSGSS